MRLRNLAPKRLREGMRYRIRRARLKRKITPRRWFSPGELLREDLSHYEPAGGLKIDAAFIADFAKARDETQSLIKKQIAFSLLVFVFLASGYLGAGLSFSVIGITLKDAPGVVEGLLLASNLLACYTMILQGNVYLLEQTIKFGIRSAIPEELRQLYIVRYFPHEAFGLYHPFNMPYMVQPITTRSLVKATAWMILLLWIAVSLTYMACNLGLLHYYLVANPKLGNWSYAIFAFIITTGVVVVMYMTLTRLRLPYWDYMTNVELDLLNQVNPDQRARRGEEIYGELINLENEMRAKGYLK